MTNSLDLIATQMSESGNKLVFGVPGGGVSLDLIDKLCALGVRFLTTNSESTAAIIAGTIGRLSGIPGVSVSIKGPGLANMMPGITVCCLENYPLLAFAESYGPNDMRRSAHKYLNHRDLTSEVVKGCFYLHADRTNFKDLTRLAVAEAPGPVLLNLVEGGQIENFELLCDRQVRSEGNPTHLLKSSNKPIVIVGSLAIRQNWGDRLEKLKIPIFTTVAAKGMLNEYSPYSAGVYTGVGLELTPEFSLMCEADCVVGIGLRNKELLKLKSFDVPSLNVESLNHHSESESGFTATVSIDLADEIFATLEEKNWGAGKLKKTKGLLIEHVLRNEFLPARVFQLIKEQFGDLVRLVVDTGNFCTISEHVWQASDPGQFLCSANGRYMGTGLPMAIGAALYDSSIPTVVALGDGGIGTYISELKLAIDERLPILVILFSDGGFGSVRSRAIREGLNQSSLLKTSPSWARVMEGFGLDSYVARDERGFLQGLLQWNWRQGPCYIETVFDPEKYQQMTTRIRS